MSATSCDRLSRYARLATANPVATNTALVGAALAGLGSSALADTYDGSGATAISAMMGTATGWTENNVFSVSNVRLNVQAGWWGATSWSVRFAPYIMDAPKVSGIAWILGGSQSRLVSAGQTPDVTSSGFAFGVGYWGTSSTGALKSANTGYAGFSMSLTNGNTVNGFIEYEWTGGATGSSFTVNQWAYNINSAITMPANSGGGAVPGLGGLAALACGAAGMRRNRQRVA
jgi:hypothetical protein